jgi:signal peptide peptidase SppA
MSGQTHDDVWAMLRAESQSWAIEPSRLSGMVALMARGERMAAPAKPSAPAPGGTAVVGIIGPLVRSGGMLSDFFGLSSYSGIRSQLNQALNERTISRILLYVDSPGGAADGCEELAGDIAAAARVKPILSFVDGLAASAGYWLASQAPQITLTPSGQVGSIGVFCMHNDLSRALQIEGVAPSFIVSKASPYKVETNPFEPLGAEARAYRQTGVDQTADKFISAVARGRNVSTAKVRSDFGRGRTMTAEAARVAGMIDRIGMLRDAIGVAPASTAATGTAAAQMTDAQRSAHRRQRLEFEAMSPHQQRASARRRRIAIAERS